MKDSDSNDREPTGFAGFESLVSDIESDVKDGPTTKSGAQRPAQEAREASIAEGGSQDSPPTASREASQPAKPGSSFKFGIPLLIVGGIVIGSILLGKDERPAPDSSPVGPAIQPSQPLPEIQSLVEEMPPVGAGLFLTSPQIRWCVYEKARIEIMRDLAGLESESDGLNSYVRQYSQRCAQFLYKPGTLEAIEAELTHEGKRLQAEGAERFIALRAIPSMPQEVETSLNSQAPAERASLPQNKSNLKPEQRQDSAIRSTVPSDTVTSDDLLEQQAIEKAKELLATKDYNKALSVLALYKEKPAAKSMIEKIKEEQFRLLKEGTEVTVTSKPY